MKKSSFFQIIKFSWLKIFKDFKVFFDISFVPFFIVLILTLLTSYHDEFVLRIYDRGSFSQTIHGSMQTRLVNLLLVTPLIAMFLANWHRYVLFDGKKPWKLMKLDLSKYSFVFIWSMIKITLTLLIPLIILIFLIFTAFSKLPTLMIIFLMGGYAAFIFFYTRLLLMFPAAAAEDDISFKRIFLLSQNNFWKIFLIYFLSLIVTFIAIFLFAFIFESLFPSNKNLISWFLINFMTLFMTFVYFAFNAACLSKIYLENKKK